MSVYTIFHSEQTGRIHHSTGTTHNAPMPFHLTPPSDDLTHHKLCRFCDNHD